MVITISNTSLLILRHQSNRNTTIYTNKANNDVGYKAITKVTVIMGMSDVSVGINIIFVYVHIDWSSRSNILEKKIFSCINNFLSRKM